MVIIQADGYIFHSWKGNIRKMLVGLHLVNSVFKAVTREAKSRILRRNMTLGHFMGIERNINEISFLQVTLKFEDTRASECQYAKQYKTNKICLHQR